jgi:hypothetical protein
MKQTATLIFCWLVTLLAPMPRSSAASGSPQPVYIFVSMSAGDYVNWSMTDERLRRSLTELEKYRKENPGLSATVYFSGALSDALVQHNAQDHLLDFVRGAIQRGAVRPGYDGSDEPTRSHRPMLDYSKANDPEARWLVRMNSAREVLTEARDPLTGAPQPGKSGGIVRMQEVFGPATIIRGVVLQQANLWGAMDEVGSDSEILNVLRQLSPSAVMVGLPDSDLAHTAGSQFRPWANVFAKMLSPAENTPPEMYWQEDVLRLSETSLLDSRTFRAEDGVEKLKAFLTSLDRSKPRIVHLEIGGQRSYVKLVRPMPKIMMPLEWADKHPDSPVFPADWRFSPAEVEQHYAQQEEVLKYLVSEFLPANSGSRFFSAADAKAMAKPGFGYDLSVESLRKSVTDILQKWGDGQTPPAYLKVDDHYLSMADMFAVFADALAQQSRSGKLPASVHLARVFGPVSTSQPKAPVTGKVTAESVAAVCTKLVDALHDDTWSERPHNAIPSPIAIDNLNVTAAQFLRLMAEALVAPTPNAQLTIKPVDMFAGRVMTFYNRRLHSDLGAPWTYKPAAVEASASSRQTSTALP